MAENNYISEIELNGTSYELRDNTARTYAYDKSDSDDRYVNINGDTMTGSLVIDESSVYIKNNDLTMNTDPSTTIDGKAVSFRDSNDSWIGRVAPRFYPTDTNAKTSNSEGIMLEARRNINNTTNYNTLHLGINETGTPVVSVSDSEAWRKELRLNCFRADKTESKALATGGGVYFGSGTNGATGTVYGAVTAANDGSIYVTEALKGNYYDNGTTLSGGDLTNAKIQWRLIGNTSNNPYIAYRFASYASGATTATWGSWVSPYWHSQASRTANTVLAAPNGSDGKATFRGLEPADIPNLAASKITSGTFNQARIPSTIEHDTALKGTFFIDDIALLATGNTDTNVTGTATNSLKWRDTASNVLAYARLSVADGTESPENSTASGTYAVERTSFQIGATRPASMNSNNTAYYNVVTLTISNTGRKTVSFSEAAAWRKGLGIDELLDEYHVTSGISATSGHQITNVVIRCLSKRMVQLNFTFKATTASTSSVKIGTLSSTANALTGLAPMDFAPLNTAYGCAYTSDFYGVYINSSGEIYARKTSTAAINASITYLRA